MQNGSQKSLSLGQYSVLAGSSALGLGYLPLAPGTWGSLMGLVGFYWMAPWSWFWQLLWCLLWTLLAIVLSHQAEKIYKTHDTSHIVIDEVVGMMWSAYLVPWQWGSLLTAFILFRLLDALKPQPIAWIDRHVEGGLGVVLDDVVAGFITCCLMHAMAFFKGGWW